MTDTDERPVGIVTSVATSTNTARIWSNLGELTIAHADGLTIGKCVAFDCLPQDRQSSSSDRLIVVKYDIIPDRFITRVMRNVLQIRTQAAYSPSHNRYSLIGRPSLFWSPDLQQIGAFSLVDRRCVVANVLYDVWTALIGRDEYHLRAQFNVEWCIVEVIGVADDQSDLVDAPWNQRFDNNLPTTTSIHQQVIIDARMDNYCNENVVANDNELQHETGAISTHRFDSNAPEYSGDHIKQEVEIATNTRRMTDSYENEDDRPTSSAMYAACASTYWLRQIFAAPDLCEYIKSNETLRRLADQL